MHAFTNKQIVGTWVGILSVSLLSGCTNWRQRYEYLNVEHANTQGQLTKAKQENSELSAKIAQDQATIDELTRQIGQGKSAASATGFPEGTDVTVSGAAGTITVTIPESIVFASGKAALKSSTIQQLDKVAAVIKDKYAGRMIDVVGNTDSDPIRKSTWEDNLQLSTERANTVVRYLIKQGIPENDIRSVGCGATRAVADNTTAAGKAKNRRVEIVVHVRRSE